MAQTIDAHHHLWRYTPEEFNWLDGPLAPLRRDYLADDLLAVLADAQVDGTVVVQARQSLEETMWLLEQAAMTPTILGVVGWAPLASRAFAREIEVLAEHRLLKGLRHVVQGEPDPEFLLGKAFNSGIDVLSGTGLVYDILIFERQMPQTIRFVDLHPEQVFVVDHIAKPRIAAGEIEPWATNLHELARRPNVLCKLSGMVTEADPSNWKVEQILPYLETALEAFGSKRLLAGSDWPVLLAGCGYGQWFQILRNFCAALTPAERAAILGETATTVYNLA